MSGRNARETIRRAAGPLLPVHSPIRDAFPFRAAFIVPLIIAHPQRGWIEMMNPGLPTSLWIQLEGKLWHATGHKGLGGILMDAQIKVSTGDRYRNSFCRCRGCVSLFDFGEEADDQDDFMTSNWFPWLGREHDGRCAIWLEIDRCQCASRLMTPRVVRETVRTEGFKGRFFCGVEACHKGPIPATCVVGALFIDRHDPCSFVRCGQSIACMLQELESFCLRLPEPPPEHPLDRAHRRGTAKQ